MDKWQIPLKCKLSENQIKIPQLKTLYEEKQTYKSLGGQTGNAKRIDQKTWERSRYILAIDKEQVVKT